MEWDERALASDFVPGVKPPTERASSYHIVVSDDEILAIDGVQPWRPLDQDEYRWLGIDEIAEHYLGHIGTVPVYVNEVDPEADNPEGYEFETLWWFLGQVEQPVFDLIGRARQIVDWHNHHQFCGECGKPTAESSFDRSRKCDDCKRFYYPRLSPSIIVLVTRGDQLLLARNSRARRNFYSTLAGFVEPGETIEEAVHREVMEEVGIRIQNLKYFGSQAWPFPNSLMLGFHAEYLDGEFAFHDDEIDDAQWFHYNELPNRPSSVSISGWLIEDYIKRLEQDA